jgi:hypothetical protein
MYKANQTAPRPDRWNKGKLVGQKAPLKLKHIWAIRVRLPGRPVGLLCQLPHGGTAAGRRHFRTIGENFGDAKARSKEPQARPATAACSGIQSR